MQDRHAQALQGQKALLQRLKAWVYCQGQAWLSTFQQ